MSGEIVFWSLLAGLVAVYAGYPLFLWISSSWRSRPVRRRQVFPSVAVVIAAYNERAHIAETVRNKIGSDYPEERLRVLVVSDSSTDGTDEVLRDLEGPRVTWLRMERREGKTAALNEALSRVQDDIVVISDANSMYERDAIRKIVENFDDSEVGYVTGRLLYERHGPSASGAGSSAYMRYENLVRRLESNVGSVVGVNGGIDAVRRSLYERMRPDQLPDFVLPLRVVEKGFRVVYDPRAVCHEAALESSHDEYGMRVRVALRALWALRDMRALLNPVRQGFFAWQLWLHKAVRYAALILLVGTLFSNALLLANRPVYGVLLTIQLVCYLAAAVGWILDRLGIDPGPLFAPYYFVLVNVAAAHAFVLFAMGRKRPTWTPRKG